MIYPRGAVLARKAHQRSKGITMTVRQFYGFDVENYTGPRYPREYFQCFDDDRTPRLPSSRDSWLRHYWPKPCKEFAIDELLNRLGRVTRFGYAKSPGRRDHKIGIISESKGALKLRFKDIEHAINRILLNGETTPSLAIRVLSGLELPGFGHLSFGSKLLMFLNPQKFVVLDRKVAKALTDGTLRFDLFTKDFADCCGQLKSQIPLSGTKKIEAILPRGRWPEIYGAWCAACEVEARRWNERPCHTGDSWFASDIERVAFSA